MEQIGRKAQTLAEWKSRTTYWTLRDAVCPAIAPSATRMAIDEFKSAADKRLFAADSGQSARVKLAFVCAIVLVPFAPTGGLPCWSSSELLSGA